MTWKTLEPSKLPLLLAGPMLRRVTASSVTVWLVLKQAATVTLTVHDTDGSDRASESHLMMSATRDTVRIGQHLHVVAVTARIGTLLQPGHVYFYDLSFQLTQGGAKTFGQALGPMAVPLWYAPYVLPSFALPGSTLADLRILQGSCRKPHGGGDDALALIDPVIANSCTQANKRPHQLLLAGDQIYSDDVADVLLPMLTVAAESLLAWTLPETVPTPVGAVSPPAYGPFAREDLMAAAGITSDDRRSHLMSFGEWMAMYLFVWSDVLWPLNGPNAVYLPTHSELLDLLDSSTATPAQKERARKAKKTVEAARVKVTTFRKALPTVRRVLANVPTYMMFDDHDVTDDWNMAYGFCSRVYADPAGQRIVQNALVAYALWQHWGNTPEQFEDPKAFTTNASRPAGTRILELLSSPTMTYDQASTELFGLVGLRPHAELLAETAQHAYGLSHKSGPTVVVQGVKVTTAALQYHFSIEAPAHQIIVTDTRTWRSFPDSGLTSAPDLIGELYESEQLDGPPPGYPPLNGRLLMVVMSTNMAMVPGVRFMRRLAEQQASDAFLYSQDLYDSWRLPSASFDRLVSKLSNKFAKDGQGVRTGQVVILSGDVHFSSACRIMYWASSRFGVDNPATPGEHAKVVLAQLVASSLKNQKTETLGMHKLGYLYSMEGNKGQAAGWFMPGPEPEGFLGWNIHPSDSLVVGTEWFMEDKYVNMKPRTARKPSESVIWLGMEGLNHTLRPQPFGAVENGVKVTKPPDYRYRVDNLRATMSWQDTIAAPAPEPMPPGTTPAQRKAALARWTEASIAYRDLKLSTQGHECVGFNNFGEITFAGSGGTQVALFKLHWKEDGDPPNRVRWVQFMASLSPDDDSKQIKHFSEP